MEEKKEKPVKGIVFGLSEFQQACPAIKKDSKAGAGNFAYKYGSLPHILEAIKPHMKKAGLVFTQPINTIEGVEYIYTTLYHVASGEKIESKVELPKIEFKGMNAVQSKGSVITYMRRYALMSLLGIVAEEDDNDSKVEKLQEKSFAPQGKDWLNPKVAGKDNPIWLQAVKYLAEGGKMALVKNKYRIAKSNEEKLKNDALAYDDIPGLNDIGPDQSNIDFDNQDNPENY